MHPYTAPLDPLRDPAGHMALPTPLFNFPNGQWDNGEGFAGGVTADHGGYLGPDEAQLDAGHIKVRVGWTVFAKPGHQPVWRFVGYLRGDKVDLGTGAVPDAGFELFAPMSIDPTKPTVIVITTFATHPVPPDHLGGWICYPGISAEGLVPEQYNPALGPFRPSPISWDLVEKAQAPATRQFNVVAGYIVPRTMARPMVFQGQRNRQFARAIQIMLQTPPTPSGQPYGLLPPAWASPETQDVACMIAGGSFGGFVAGACLVAYPGDFDGALCASMSSSMRRLVDEHQSYVYATTRLGFGISGSAYDLRDALELPTFVRQFERLQGLSYYPSSDYYNFSLSVQDRAGNLPFPLSFVIGDEDTVSTGNDWLPVWTNDRRLVSSRSFGSPPAERAIQVMDKRCHFRGDHVTALGGVLANDLTPATLELLGDVHLAHLNPPSIVGTPLPQLPVVPVNDIDVHEHALGRSVRPPTSGSVLQLDPGFGIAVPGQTDRAGRTQADGLTFGWDESLAVDGESDMIWVGSADGIVTRFEVITGVGIESRAHSQWLGYGAFALERGDIDGDGSPEIVVGTHRHLHVLDATTLQPVVSKFELSYEHTRPRRIAIGEIFGGGDDEIVFTTLHGHVVVMGVVGGALTILADLPEPGVQDLLITGKTHDGQADSDAIVTLLSHRGHLVNVQFNQDPDPTGHGDGTSPSAYLECWSEPQIGRPWDLEFVQDGGTAKIAALFGSGHSSGGIFGAKIGAPATNRTYPIGVFDVTTLEFDGTADALLNDGTLGTSGNDNMDLAVVKAKNGDLYYLALADNVLFMVRPDPAGLVAPQERKVLFQGQSEYVEAIAIQVADVLDPAPGELFSDDLVVSTATGRVAAIRLDRIHELPAAPSPQALSLDVPADLVGNTTTAGCWGFAVGESLVTAGADRVQIVNQSGQRFEVDPLTGVVAALSGPMKRAGVLPDGSINAVDTGPATRIRTLTWLGDAKPIAGAQHGVVITDLPIPLDPGVWGYSTRPPQNADKPLAPVWRYGWDAPLGEPDVQAPGQTVQGGWALLGLGGDALTVPALSGGSVTHVHWWGGIPPLISKDLVAWTFPNLIQGFRILNPAAAQRSIEAGWFSTKAVTSSPLYGRSIGDCKDLRNNVSDILPINNLQALRLVSLPAPVGPQGGLEGVVIIASTPGGSAFSLRPGNSTTDHGQILSDTDVDLQLDDGYGAMALAVRPTRDATGTPTGSYDVFVGVTWAHLDPAPFALHQESKMVGAVRFLRLDPSTGQLSTPLQPVDSILYLDAGAGDSGGYAVSGLAVGDLIPGGPDELVITTLDGDVLVYEVGPDQISSSPVFRTTVDGSLGAWSSIYMGDIDGVAGNELYVAGSRGVWKWLVNTGSN